MRVIRILLALIAHSSALALRAQARSPLALGRATVRLALPSAVGEFVPENVAADAAQMKQVEELWKVCCLACACGVHGGACGAWDFVGSRLEGVAVQVLQWRECTDDAHTR